MFCDVVGSTGIAGRVDAEELRELLLGYQSACETEIQRFGGQVARLLGDGVLAYFGYPQAHEDDAERAVRAGFGIISRTLRQPAILQTGALSRQVATPPTAPAV